MSRAADVLIARHSGFPRVSGDEPPTATDAELTPVFSPRERG